MIGLPCVHYMERIQGAPLSIDDFHPHWRIDGFLGVENDVVVDTRIDGDIQPVLDRFLQNYNGWGLPQQIQARQRIQELTLTRPMDLRNPVPRQGRGRPVGARNRPHDTSSTRRDPSGFEVAERVQRRCGRCRQPGHNIRNCPNPATT
jgi:hypothetical protein